ncbi:MAG: terminase small subunit [Bacillota bacterium]
MTERTTLTNREKVFVQEYLIDLNHRRAAERAGYKASSADKMGRRLLARPRVQAAIAAAMAERAQRTKITQDAVIEQLAKIAFADLKDFVSFGPHGVEIRDSNLVDGTVLSEVSQIVSKNGGSQRVKLHDKLKALELLGKHLGMFVDRQEITGPNGGPLRIEIPGLNPEVYGHGGRGEGTD